MRTWRIVVCLSCLTAVWLRGAVAAQAEDFVAPPAAAPVVASATAVVDAPKFELTRNMVYHQLEDGHQLRCDAWVPTGEGPFPAVLCVHGGAWMTGTKEHMRHVAERLAQAGYTAVSINYRLAPKHQFPAQIDDCRAAVAWLQSEAKQLKIDAARVGGFGYSAGAHLVSLLATQAPQADKQIEVEATKPALRCVVAGGAPCDFRQLPPDAKFLAYWLGGTRAEKPLQYELASPRRFVTASAAPAFYFHGERDFLVPRESPEQMVASLQQAGVKASLYVVPQAGHAAALFSQEAIARAITFLDAELKQE